MIGNRRYVWYDELFTLGIARSMSLQQLWSRELRFDNHTPTIYLPIPGKIEEYSSFVSQHREFLLIGEPREWVFTKLRLEGASIAYLDDYKEAKPYSETVLYLVTMPAIPARRFHQDEMSQTHRGC
jgi:hypothetical protein